VVPRFYFHVHDPEEAHDDEGLELASVDDAWSEAIRSARSLACEQVLQGNLCLHHWIEIEDEAGAVVGVVMFNEAVTVDR
jgi:hypothetical protein